MVTRLPTAAAALALAAALAPRAARADDAQPLPAAAAATSPAAPTETARLHHAPPATAEVHERLELQARIEHPELLRRAMLVFRVGSGALREVPFERAVVGPWIASVPGELVTPQGLAYTIELEGADGARSSAFASRAEPHRVQVADDAMDTRERALDARLGGRRSVVSTSTDFVSFGTTTGSPVTRSGGPAEQAVVSDRYYRIEAGYTYRLHRTVEQFGIRGGIVRGQSPVPGVTTASDAGVGLNYGAPTVRLRLADAWHLEGELLTSITEVGFSVGTGATLLVGDPYGSSLSLGFETIHVFGTRVFTRLDLAVRPGWTVSPVVEVTDMPHADKFGLRLFAETRHDLGAGFSAALRGGYQARASTDGGPAAGLSVAYAF